MIKKFHFRSLSSSKYIKKKFKVPKSSVLGHKGSKTGSVGGGGGGQASKTSTGGGMVKKKTAAVGALIGAASMGFDNFGQFGGGQPESKQMVGLLSDH